MRPWAERVDGAVLEALRRRRGGAVLDELAPQAARYIPPELAARQGRRRVRAMRKFGYALHPVPTDLAQADGGEMIRWGARFVTSHRLQLLKRRGLVTLQPGNVWTAVRRRSAR